MTTAPLLSRASRDCAENWPPRYLPEELSEIAYATDTIRHTTDELWDGGAGVCLGVSGYISYLLLEKEIEHKLCNGIYRDSEGDHPHWWIETASGWILDGSRGQFTHEDGHYRSGVTQRTDGDYKSKQHWEPGHSSMELVEAELKRCFGEPSEALYYLDVCEDLWREAQSHRSTIEEN